MTDRAQGSDDTSDNQIIIQLAPHLATARNATLLELADAAGLTSFQKVLYQFGSPPSRRLIQSVPLDRLLEVEERAKSGPLPPLFSLASFWRVDFREGKGEIREFVARLRELPEVVDAHVDTGFGPAAVVNPADDPDYGLQGHLEPSPVGVDAPFAWLQTGGDGAGVGVMDLEGDWNFQHEDLVSRAITLEYGVPSTNPVDIKHGTAALGTILASDNTVGGLGVAPGVTDVRTLSHWAIDGTKGNVAAAIYHASEIMSKGDVLVLETQTLSTTPPHLPSEYRNAEFAATRLAVDRGIVVIAAAGNGQQNLDTIVGPSGGLIFNPNDAGYRYSGAIMVAGGLSTVPHGRGVSNYGSRIDCYAWGENVHTTGWNFFQPNKAYGLFDGTSSATAIIAGVALCIQGVAEAGPGRLQPEELRTMLRDPSTGTPSASAADRISVMPDLRRVLTKAALVPDVYMRAALGDTGEPAVKEIGVSPDIILWNTQVADPNAQWGEGSGRENRDDLGARPVANGDAWVHLRFRNRGAPAAQQISGRVLWSPPATVTTPGHWSMIGTTTTMDVPSGDTLVVSDGVLWPSAARPPLTHVSLMAVLDGPTDPAPPLPGPGDWPAFLAFLSAGNNTAMRNICLVRINPRDSTYVFPLPSFAFAGAEEIDLPFDFEIVQRLPDGVNLRLRAPRDFDAFNGQGGPPRLTDEAQDTLLFSFPAVPVLAYRRIRMTAGRRPTVCFELKISQGVRLAGHSVSIRQLYRGREVGRLTWRMLAPARRRTS
jgi:serine protease